MIVISVWTFLCRNEIETRLIRPHAAWMLSWGRSYIMRKLWFGGVNIVAKGSWRLYLRYMEDVTWSQWEELYFGDPLHSILRFSPVVITHTACLIIAAKGKVFSNAAVALLSSPLPFNGVGWHFGGQKTRKRMPHFEVRARYSTYLTFPLESRSGSLP